MSFDKYELTVNEQIRYLCDLLHREMALFENCCFLLKELNRSLRATISNWYWFNEQTNIFILFASSSDKLSNYGEYQVRLNDFFTGRLLRGNYEPYQIFVQKTGYYKHFLTQPLQIRGTLTGCILIQSITPNQEYEYERYFLTQLVTTLNIELPGLLQISNPSEHIGYSVLNELSFIFDQIINIKHLAKLVVRNACLFFEAQTSILSLYNPTMDCFEILDSFSMLASDAVAQLLKFDNSVAMKTTSAATLFRMENLIIEQFDQFGSPAITVITICLRNQNTILGALSLYGKKQYTPYERRDFTLSDQELFVHFSDLVASQLSRFLLSGF